LSFLPIKAGGARKERPVADEEIQMTAEEIAELKAEREALIAKRDELLTEVKQTKGKLKIYDGIDPEEHKTLKQRLAEIETQDKAGKAGITSQELERLRAEVRKSLEDEYTPFRTNAEKLAAENRSLKLDNVVKTEMAKSGVRAERIDSLFRLTQDAFDLTEDGKPILKNNIGVEIGKYVREDLLNEYPEWFEGSGSSGGGASKSVSSGGGKRVITGAEAFSQNIEAIAKGTAVYRP
jgi:hypothetical protein